MHKQRLDQLESYLSILNIKAQRKKKILQGLLELWKSTKLLTKGSVSSGATLALSREDILHRTRDIQRAVVDDMRKEPDTALAQVRFFFVLLQRIKNIAHRIVITVN